MNPWNSRLLRLSVPFFLLASAQAQQWTPPTPEELSMTSIPEVPGAPAVYLFKEQIAEDSLHMWSYYYRVKVLTEGGKDFANVELPYLSGSSGFSLDSIAGRTIHPDGSITPFTGKPYDKLVEKVGGYKVNAKVFSLPDVQVGSILEYRYKLRYDDSFYSPPDWYVQSDLYTRKAHYLWHPTTRELMSDAEGVISTVAWTPMLPAGAKVVQSIKGGQNTIELAIADVKPQPKESNMPPVDSFSYRVLFYYTGYRTADEYWKNTGKRWSGARNKFMDYGSVTKAQVKELLQPGDTDEQKVKKIYTFVGTLDNTAFSRSHSSTEDRAQGFNKDLSNVDEVLKRKRGSDDQLTELFVAMVRAAGMKAYLMAVSNRDHRFFIPGYLSLGQLDDDVAIVPLNGKEVFFDPGQRYCAFGHLAWKHSMTDGIRQTEGGTVLAGTPGESYKEAHITRIADLTLDEHGSATGSVTVTFTGDPALAWRQEALRGDDTSLNKDLRTDMENTLPGGMEVRVTKVEGLADVAQPLTVIYEIKGAVGSPTGKRLLIPANLFEVKSKAKFVAAGREMPIDLHYASYVQDAVRFKLPTNLVIESAPETGKEQLLNVASYSTSVKNAPHAITLYRNLVLGRAVYGKDEYPGLREFYNKLEAKDQESLVLTRASAPAPIVEKSTN